MVLYPPPSTQCTKCQLLEDFANISDDSKIDLGFSVAVEQRKAAMEVRPRRPRAPGSGGPSPDPPGPLPGVSPDQDAAGVLPHRLPGEPLANAGVGCC